MDTDILSTLSPSQLEQLYTPEASAYFAETPWALPLWEAAAGAILSLDEGITVKWSRTQASFRTRYVFACLSLPYRRKKGWPKECLVLTLGLGEPVEHPRIAVKTEAAPGRWTHHLLVSRETPVDDTVTELLRAAYDFSFR